MRRFSIADFRFSIGVPAVFILVLALALLAVPGAAEAQQPAKIYRIGFLAPDPAPAEPNPQHCPIKGSPAWQGWVEGLREHGYIPGQNLVIECRYAAGRWERLPALAAEVVSLKPDLILAVGNRQVSAAKEATRTIPIVMVNIVDPVEWGLIASYARPGGNVTGLTWTATAGLETGGKNLQLLKEVVPTLSRVAVLSDPAGVNTPSRRQNVADAQALGLTLQFYDIWDPSEYEAAFAAMPTARVQGLNVHFYALNYTHARKIADLAAQSRLPAVYGFQTAVPLGGLMAYAVNNAANFRRAATYVDKIFKGAKPGDLPVEQPTKFDLLINLKTAKALSLTIPQSLLIRADEVIE
jgi:putative ABC transport system substrate-binding protein